MLRMHEPQYMKMPFDVRENLSVHEMPMNDFNLMHSSHQQCLFSSGQQTSHSSSTDLIGSVSSENFTGGALVGTDIQHQINEAILDPTSPLFDKQIWENYTKLIDDD